MRSAKTTISIISARRSQRTHKTGITNKQTSARQKRRPARATTTITHERSDDLASHYFCAEHPSSSKISHRLANRMLWRLQLRAPLTDAASWSRRGRRGRAHAHERRATLRDRWRRLAVRAPSISVSGACRARSRPRRAGAPCTKLTGHGLTWRARIASASQA